MMFLFSYSAFSQEKVDWVKTEGIIKELEVKRRGRTFATVSFQTKEGATTEAYTELFALPIIGSFTSVGDTITIFYDKNNPVIVKSESGKFLSQYGMILLIVLGVVFSVKRFINMRKYQKN